MNHEDAEADRRRMVWASRRGLLELDLLLGPFMTGHYATLTAALKADYAALMVEADQDILNWIMGRTPVERPELRAVVAKIRSVTPGLGDQLPPGSEL